MAIVAKFGGTSMQDKLSMERAAKIVLANPDIQLIVVSATAGTTNSLLKLSKLFSHVDLFHDHETLEKDWQVLYQRHLNLAQELNLNHIQRALQELYLEAKVVGKTLTKGMNDQNNSYKKQVDRILSVGERSSALIFGEYLHSLNPLFSPFDVRKVMKTNSEWGHAAPLYDEVSKEVRKELMPHLSQGRKFVTEGFIGSTLSGNTTTLGRGGSDFSAAILGKAINATEIQIWTDVAGMYSTDPRIVKEAQIISELSFEEASEMCNFGAKVLHPNTILPAIEGKIPVKVLSTFEPEKKGTTIIDVTEKAPHYRSITLRKNQTLLLLSKTPKRLESTFLSQIFHLFEEYKVPVDLINTSEVNLALTLDESMGPVNLNPNFVQKLTSLCTFTEIKNLHLIAVVGNKLNFEQILSHAKFFDLKLINYGASLHNICFLVPENEGESMVKALHLALIEGKK